MKKTFKKIPRFKNEDAERAFWATHEVVDYFDITKAKRITFSKLQPSTKTISLRLPKFLLEQIQLLAREEDIPYQSFMKHILFEKVRQTAPPKR